MRVTRLTKEKGHLEFYSNRTLGIPKYPHWHELWKSRQRSGVATALGNTVAGFLLPAPWRPSHEIKSAWWSTIARIKLSAA
ncbi:MAG TPA: hypothetical protein VIS99_03265 [Terrimicrobiaceae bacterium]